MTAECAGRNERCAPRLRVGRRLASSAWTIGGTTRARDATQYATSRLGPGAKYTIGLDEWHAHRTEKIHGFAAIYGPVIARASYDPVEPRGPFAILVYSTRKRMLGRTTTVDDGTRVLSASRDNNENVIIYRTAFCENEKERERQIARDEERRSERAST